MKQINKRLFSINDLYNTGSGDTSFLINVNLIRELNLVLLTSGDGMALPVECLRRVSSSSVCAICSAGCEMGSKITGRAFRLFRAIQDPQKAFRVMNAI